MHLNAFLTHSTSNNAHGYITKITHFFYCIYNSNSKPFIFVLHIPQGIGPSSNVVPRIKSNNLLCYLHRPEYRAVLSLAFLLVSDRNTDVLFMSLWCRLYRPFRGLVFHLAQDLCSASGICLAHVWRECARTLICVLPSGREWIGQNADLLEAVVSVR